MCYRGLSIHPRHSNSYKRFSYLILVTLWATLFFAANTWMLDAQEDNEAVRDQIIRMQQERKKEERQKLKSLADQLQKESGDLKALIDQTPPHTVSLNIMKKIGEIEKTLKEIKNMTKP